MARLNGAYHLGRNRRRRLNIPHPRLAPLPPPGALARPPTGEIRLLRDPIRNAARARGRGEAVGDVWRRRGHVDGGV